MHFCNILKFYYNYKPLQFDQWWAFPHFDQWYGFPGPPPIQTKLLDCLVNDLEVVHAVLPFFANCYFNKSTNIKPMPMIWAWIKHLWHWTFSKWAVQETRVENMLSLWRLWFINLKRMFSVMHKLKKSEDISYPTFCDSIQYFIFNSR